MKRYALEITTLSPLLLSPGPQAAQMTESLEFIPGNAIRGLLAAHYLQLGGAPEDEDFRALFLTGTSRFGFAWIDGSQPIPLSAYSCKYDGGFSKDPGHGVVDLAGEKSGQRLACTVCASPLDYHTGFWDPEAGVSRHVLRRIITRTAVDSRRDAAGEGNLYSQKVIEENQCFKSEIEVPQFLAGALERLLKQPFTGMLGKGRSRGQGWVRVHATDARSVDLGTAADRARQWQRKSAARQPELVVTFLSDAILADRYLRDRTVPVPEEVVSLGISGGDWEAEPRTAFSDQRMVFGFDGYPLNLPRVPRLAIRAGSVFVFQARSGCTPAIPATGGTGFVGEHCREGYGRVVLWHPFHLQPDSTPHRGA